MTCRRCAGRGWVWTPVEPVYTSNGRRAFGSVRRIRSPCHCPAADDWDRRIKESTDDVPPPEAYTAATEEEAECAIEEARKRR